MANPEGSVASFEGSGASLEGSGARFRGPWPEAGSGPKSGFFRKCPGSLRGAPGAPPESPARKIPLLAFALISGTSSCEQAAAEA